MWRWWICYGEGGFVFAKEKALYLQERKAQLILQQPAFDKYTSIFDIGTCAELTIIGIFLNLLKLVNLMS